MQKISEISGFCLNTPVPLPYPPGETEALGVSLPDIILPYPLIY